MDTVTFITAITLAEDLNVTRRTVGRMINDPELNLPAPVRLKGRLYFRKDQIEFLETRARFKRRGEARGALAGPPLSRRCAVRGLFGAAVGGSRVGRN